MSEERKMTLEDVARIVCEAIMSVQQAQAAAAEAQRLLRGLQTTLIEERAKVIYDRMPYDGVGVKPEWVEGGNSLKQEEARKRARTVLFDDAISAPVVPHRTSS